MKKALQSFVIAFCLALGLGFGFPDKLSAQVFTEPAKPRATQRKPRPSPSTPTRGGGARQEPRVPSRVAAPAPPPPPTFDEPDAYCVANPNALGPDAGAAGALPQWLSNGWKLASNNAQQTNSFALRWKCSGGRVVACGSPIGEDFCSKPEAVTEASPEMSAYCADKRKGAVPRELTGNTTSVWVCKNRKPVLAGTRTDIDADGYLANTWLDITPYAPANMVGDTPRIYVTSWAVPVKVGVFGSLTLSGNMTSTTNPTGFVTTFSAMQIVGGKIGQVIGTNVYYGETPDRQVRKSGCEAQLILTGASMASLAVSERYAVQSTRCRKPETYVLQVRDGQMLVNWMEPGKVKPKRSEWVQPFK